MSKMFPILLTPAERRQVPDCPLAIPWQCLAPYAKQAERNHCGQTLERLAERGGLDPREIVAVITERPGWFARLVSLEEAVAELLTLQAGKGPCPTGEHEWHGQQQGGAPDTAEAAEWACHCKKCGLEKLCD